MLKKTVIFCLVLLFSVVGSAQNTVSTRVKNKSKKQKESPFQASVSLMYQSPFDTVEAINPQGTVDPLTLVSASASYKLNKSQSLGFRTRYYHTWLSAADDNSYAGMLDSDFLFSHNNFWSHKAYQLSANYQLGVTLPTSRFSQVAGLRFGPWGTVMLNKKAGRFGLMLMNTVGINSYKYDTADEAGSFYNESHYWLIMAGAEFAIDKKQNFALGAMGGLYTSQDYQKLITRNYMASAYLNYKINKNFLTNLSLSTQDQRSDNYNLFLYDRLFWALGITISV